MKRVLMLAFATFALSFSFAATAPVKKGKLNAADVLIPVSNTGTKISLLDLSEIKIGELERLTGRKMKFFDRLGFKAAQRQLKKNIHTDGTINTKKMEKRLKKRDGQMDIHLGGFALGFLLGPIGVLIAYLLNDGKKTNRIKWSWIGFGALAVIVLIAMII